jgi:hypothetical protein
VVEVGTGGDDFHAPARALYESLRFHLVPVAVEAFQGASRTMSFSSAKASIW